MVQSFPDYVAARYLETRRKGAFVRIMVRFAKGGVALGVFVLVVTTALMNGFSQEIQANLWKATSHFFVSHVLADLPDTAGTLARIRSVPEVVGATPLRQDYALVRGNYPGSVTNPLLVLGVEPASVRSTTAVLERENLQPIRIEELQEGQIVIGDEAADRFGVKVGGELVVTFLRESMGLGGTMPKTAVFKVAGLFHSGISEYDKGWGYIHLADAQRIAGSRQATHIGVRVRDVERIEAVQGLVLTALGQKDNQGPFLLHDLRTQNRMLFAAMKVQKWIFTGILSLIVLVATFNIVSSLVLFITEKRRDLGVLLSLGATPTQIQRIFELQGLRIAVTGTLWGLCTAIPACLVADRFRLVRLPPAAYDFITYIPFRLSVLDLLIVATIPALVAWLASRFPARRAASVDPVDALRAE
jgi:lipoprotein-releasing system permease protein